MRIAEYKQIDTKIKKKILHHETKYDEEGQVIKPEWDEEIEIKVPVMGVVYRNMTSEEIEEMEKQQELEKGQKCQEPTQEDRIEAQVMYTALMTDTLLESEV